MWEIRRIKCLFGKHDISPTTEIVIYGKIYYRCRKCNKLIDSGKCVDPKLFKRL